MFQGMESGRRRWLTLLAFGLVTLFIMAGFSPAVGRETAEREDFSFDQHPVWQATDRADENLEAEYWPIFSLVAGEGPGVRGNALDVEVLREVTQRHDRVMADGELVAYFDVRFNWMVRRNTTTGPWSIAETVRDVMDRRSPMAGPAAQGGIDWTGPDFANATQAEVTALLNFLLNTPNPAGTAYPHRGLLASDLCVRSSDGATCTAPVDPGTGEPLALVAQPGETWVASGFYIPAYVNTTRLYADYSRTPGSDNFYEYYEQRFDAYYSPPLEVAEPVETYSYVAIGLEIQGEIEETGPLVLVSFIMMLVVLAFFFRNWKDVACSGLGLMLLMIWISGTAAWLGYPQTQLSAMLPILLLALGVDFAIHSLHRWRRQARQHPAFATDPKEASLAAAWQSIASLSPALGVATVTTIVAFGTATLSEIPDVREWGFLAAINIAQAYLLLGIFTPVLRSGWAPPPAASAKGAGAGFFASLKKVFDLPRLAEYQHRYAVPFVVVFLLVTLLLSPLVLGNPSADFDAADYMDNDSRFIRTLVMGKETFTGSGEPGFYLIEGARLQEPATLAAVDQLEQALRDNDRAEDYRPSIISVLRVQLNYTANGGPGYVVTEIDPATGLPVNAEDTIRVLGDIRTNGTRNHIDPSQATFSFGPGEARELYQLEGDNLVRLRVWFDVIGADDWAYMEELLVELERWQQPLAAQPGVAAQVAGVSYSRYVYVNEITDNFQTSLLIAIGASFLILLVVLRNPLLSLIAILPVSAITLWLRGGMVLTDTSVNLVTVQISSLAIGLGIDYTIHIVQRVREARRAAPAAGQLAWMQETMEETGAALSASAATDFLGFMILTLSAMPLFFMFGLIMALMILLSLVSALVLLPPLLMKFGRLEARAQEMLAEESDAD